MARPSGYRRDAVRRTRDALVASRGNIVAASRVLGVTRGNVWDMVNRHKELQELCAELMEENKDDWEAQLNRLAMDKDNVVATLALLNAKARERGYNRTVNDVNVTGTVDHRHLHLHIHNEHLHKLKDAELNRLIEERRAALPEHMRDAGPLELTYADQRPRLSEAAPAPPLIEGEASED